ncbi:MAG: hypothetical protein OEM06_08575 [Desulfobacteraceae bacterium]|nr:hypothetical protein [Desulfobacteraceae bacterium]
MKVNKLKQGASHMKNNPIHDPDVGFSTAKVLASNGSPMDRENLQITERIEEIMMMCPREKPIYEDISSFSIALYALGFFDCSDMLSFDDVDSHEAADFLREHFSEIKPEALPRYYRMVESEEKYLLVVGDPLFPIHFAVLVDSQSPSLFFSKLPFFGSGFDSLDELKSEFVGIDGITPEDFHFFIKNRYGEIPPVSRGKIYVVRND